MSTPSQFRDLLQKPEHQKLALEEDLILSVTSRIYELMREKKVKKADLATALGVSPARVSQMLSGQANITLRTLANVYFVLQRRADVGDHPFVPSDLLPKPENKNDEGLILRMKLHRTRPMKSREVEGCPETPKYEVM